MESGLASIKICEGFTGHARHLPVKNAFRYPVLYVRFDLGIANQVDAQLKRAIKFFSFSSTDYLIGGKTNLEDRAKQFLKQHMDYDARDITLVTIPQLFGYAFNPVSFWFCRRDLKLEGVLCEVNNTFGERHFYWVLPNPDGGMTKVEKQFHVSPFLPVEGFYQFKFVDDSDKTHVDIDYYGSDNQKILSTWVELQNHALEKTSGLALLAKYGWVTALVVIRIHWQAMKLFFKKVRFFKKPVLPANEVTK